MFTSQITEEADALTQSNSQARTSLSPMSDESSPLLHQTQGRARSSVSHILGEPAGSHHQDDKSSPVVRQIFRFKLFAVMICFFISGSCTTGIGALINGIKQYYTISDGTTSIIFPTGVAGYLVATTVLQTVLRRYGWRGVAVLAPAMRLVSTVILSTGLPFALVLPGFFIHGFSIGLADSGFCAWASKVTYANVVQGMMHGSFSIGAVLGPVIALAVAKRGSEWYGFYWLLAALTCLEIVALVGAFFRDGPSGQEPSPADESTSQPKNPLQITAVWICGVFYFVYVGVECSYSDWTIEFMRRVRRLDPAVASLSSSAFWIGMTGGRLLLGPVTERFGLEICVTSYIALSTTFQILFKWTLHATGSLVLLGATGFFLGPMFPSAVILLARKVPAMNNVGAIAAAAAMGQLGGASAPLAIGLLADKYGIGRMLDVVLGLSIVLLLIWIGFCRFRPPVTI